MVEPSDSKQEPLREAVQEIGNAHLVQCARSNAEGTHAFFDGATGASMFKENTPIFMGAKPTTVATRRLDNVVAEVFGKDARPSFIKLDLQGAELLALQGAGALIESANAVMVEMSVVEYNSGGSCYWELDAWLREHGFFPLVIQPLPPSRRLFKTPGVGQYDAVYVRATSTAIAEYGTKFCSAGAGTHVEKRAQEISLVISGEDERAHAGTMPVQRRDAREAGLPQGHVQAVQRDVTRIRGVTRSPDVYTIHLEISSKLVHLCLMVGAAGVLVVVIVRRSATKPARTKSHV
eukprot:TRINITY_DN9763_c0_g1_i1.p1 TRINITY_DN9763_c0_g1~~TRINITY_DN9763_c0_g1_i1.p1  ORF type:complete len:292 (+),score=58.67 TRINITY_DN9763_c0_g1_i1:229-1104(+)